MTVLYVLGLVVVLLLATVGWSFQCNIWTEQEKTNRLLETLTKAVEGTQVSIRWIEAMFDARVEPSARLGTWREVTLGELSEICAFGEPYPFGCAVCPAKELCEAARGREPWRWPEELHGVSLTGSKSGRGGDR